MTSLFPGNIFNVLTFRSQLEEEIYTEICANTNARVLNTVESYNQAMLPLGTQSSTNNSSIALSTSGTQLTSTLARKMQPVTLRNSGGCGSHISGESALTQDTALYTNLRTNSRPSSMLFNDAGFVRFRIGNDQSELRQSCEELVQAEAHNPASSEKTGPEQAVKGSRSFDNSVLSVLEKKQLSGESFRQLERPQSNMSYVKEAGDSRAIKSELCSPDRPDVEFLPGIPQRPASKLATHSHPAPRRESESDTGEQYETPAGMILPSGRPSLAAQVRSVVGYSESDLSSVDPLYAGRSIYGYGRAPSRCSSISATQSFDMRVYGRTGVGGSGQAGPPPWVAQSTSPSLRTSTITTAHPRDRKMREPRKPSHQDLFCPHRETETQGSGRHPPHQPLTGLRPPLLQQRNLCTTKSWAETSRVRRVPTRQTFRDLVLSATTTSEQSPVMPEPTSHHDLPATALQPLWLGRCSSPSPRGGRRTRAREGRQSRVLASCRGRGRWSRRLTAGWFRPRPAL